MTNLEGWKVIFSTKSSSYGNISLILEVSDAVGVYHVHRHHFTGRPCGLGSHGSCNVYRPLFTGPHGRYQVNQSLIQITPYKEDERKQKIDSVDNLFKFCFASFVL